MASRHFKDESDIRENKEDEGGSETDSDASSYSYSDYSDDLVPEWLDDVQKNGELFYLELSEGEEEALLAQVSASHSAATNHVRFSEKEAEIITDNGKKQAASSNKTEAKLKKFTKILRRKRRPSQRKAADGKDAGSSQRPTSILKNQAGQRPGVVVQQQRLKDVCVYLNPKRLGGSSSPSPERGGLLEALLGVVHRPGGNAGKKGGKLIIHGLVPHSPASKCAEILIGDALVAVDDVDVTSENIERVLSCIPGPTQLRLTLETVCPAGRAPDSRAKAAPVVSQLVRLLWGEDTVELQMSIAHVPHIVMYLSLKLDSDSPQDEQEILYQYPASEAAVQLKAVRGIFLTLCDMLENVTGGQIVSSSLWLRQQLVHVGYWKEGSSLLVIAVPASRVPLLYLQTVIEGAVRTLKVMHGSLDSCFCEEENAPRLDHFFCLFFQQLIQPWRLIDSSRPPSPDISGSLFLDGLPAVCWLTLPADIKVEVDTVLSDFESSDFGDMSEDFYGMRRLYVILGSCLFYKGYLIANHLPKEDLLDVCLYCQHYCLLPLASEQRVGQLVVWREVFPQRRTQNNTASHPGYCEPHGRHFLLIVGLLCITEINMGRSLFGEAGSGSSSLRGRRPSPQRSLSDSGSEGHADGTPSFTSGLSPHSTPDAVHRMPSSGTRRDSLGSGGSDGSLGSAGFFKIPRSKHPNPFYLGSLRKSLTDRETEEMHSVLKLTAGAENTLFHYVLMETVQGIFIAPTHREMNHLSGSIHPQLIQNFYHCCLSIRQAFQQSLPSRVTHLKH
ncbi:protein inturned-like [Sinocyclocheilus rhinocerous]|uniref:protein inturned-like n=1 Tax=Sinocyclocheilus rhinocerous TaxID=307959 RepID=UPI0007BA7996|nr:PREDICTED: protein inturned-like [Sinocyclocheilus rhinocerous]